MTITAAEFLSQLEQAGVNALRPPESPVTETCAIMGALETSQIEQSFEAGQNDQSLDQDATPTMGFEPS